MNTIEKTLFAVLRSALGDAQGRERQDDGSQGRGPGAHLPGAQLRECGDIDIFCFDDYRKVNEFVVSRGIGKNPAESDWEEFCFEFGGIEVENHGRFTTDCNAANRDVDEVLLRMNAGAAPSQDPGLPGILMPAPQVGALHLIMHTLSHLAWSGITVRPVEALAHVRRF